VLDHAGAAGHRALAVNRPPGRRRCWPRSAAVEEWKSPMLGITGKHRPLILLARRCSATAGLIRRRRWGHTSPLPAPQSRPQQPRLSGPPPRQSGLSLLAERAYAPCVASRSPAGAASTLQSTASAVSLSGSVWRPWPAMRGQGGDGGRVPWPADAWGLDPLCRGGDAAALDGTVASMPLIVRESRQGPMAPAPAGGPSACVSGGSDSTRA